LSSAPTLAPTLSIVAPTAARAMRISTGAAMRRAPAQAAGGDDARPRLLLQCVRQKVRDLARVGLSLRRLFRSRRAASAGGY
jgi:hypothetical protein